MNFTANGSPAVSGRKALDPNRPVDKGVFVHDPTDEVGIVTNMKASIKVGPVPAKGEEDTRTSVEKIEVVYMNEDGTTRMRYDEALQQVIEVKRYYDLSELRVVTSVNDLPESRRPKTA